LLFYYALVLLAGQAPHRRIFWLCAVLSAALVVLVALMQRSVAEKGEHIGAE